MGRWDVPWWHKRIANVRFRSQTMRWGDSNQYQEMDESEDDFQEESDNYDTEDGWEKDSDNDSYVFWD